MCVCVHTHKQVGNYLRNRYKRVIWLKDPLAQFDLIFLLIKKRFFFFFFAGQRFLVVLNLNIKKFKINTEF